MRRLLMLLFVFIATAQLFAQTVEKTVPFTVVLKKLEVPEAPKLQGFAFGRAGARWLVVAGRHAGLHTFNKPTTANPVNNFPPKEFNDRIFVIDPRWGKVWSAPLTGLPAKTAARLTVTNSQFEQSGDWLYIAGGYGFDPATGKMDTFGSLTAINVPETVDAIVNGHSFAPYVQQIDDLRMQVTGGEMKKLGDWFVLVFGQKFQGLYTPNDSQIGLQFKQLYSEQIALFKIVMPNGKLAISDYQQPITAPPVNSTDVSVTRPFHRRDFSLAQFVDVNGKSGLAAYGGVFLPGQIGAYRNPVFPDPRHRAVHLAGVAISLMQCRRYDVAQAVMSAAARLANAAEFQTRADLFSKLKRWEDILVPEDDHLRRGSAAAVRASVSSRSRCPDSSARTWPTSRHMMASCSWTR